MARHLVLLFALYCGLDRLVAQSLPTLVPEPRPPVMVGSSASQFATWLGDSVLALADGEEQRVMLIDVVTGKTRAVGRPGDGPGEFRGVNPPLRAPDGSLLVIDSRLRRATVFTADLAVRRVVGLPVVISSVLRWDGTTLLCTWYDFSRLMVPVLGRLRMISAEQAEPEPMVRLDSLFGMIKRDPFSLPPIVVAAPAMRDNVYLAKVDEYRILKLGPERRVIRTYQRRDVPVRRFSAQEIDAEAGRIRAAGSAPVPPAAAARARQMLAGLVKPFFTINGLSEDPEGRLWVVSSRQGNGQTEVDVFSPGGRFLGTIKLRGHVKSLAWRGNRVAAVVERSEGEEGLGAVDFYRLGR
jgi:hypothetical protein